MVVGFGLPGDVEGRAAGRFAGAEVDRAGRGVRADVVAVAAVADGAAGPGGVAVGFGDAGTSAPNNGAGPTAR